MKKKNQLFEVKIFEELTQDLSDKILEFKESNIGIRSSQRTEEERLTHKDKYSSGQDIKRWILAFENDSVIGMIKVYKRDIKVDDKIVLLGGIGGVRVAIDKRKMGIAGKMMISAMKELKELNCEVALLGTNLDSFLADWYKKYSFDILSKKYKYLGKSGKEYIAEDGMIAPINSKETYNQIQQSDDTLNIGQGNW